MRDSFIFYRSFFETMKKIPKKDRLQFVEAICNYALDDEEISLSGVNTAIFELVKPQIDANFKRYENGKKGGRPKKPNQNQNETKAKPNHNQTITKPKPNVNDNVNVNVNVNDNVLGFENEPSETSPSVVINYLNSKTGADYDPEAVDNVELISDLIDQGYDTSDLIKVIDNKCAEWLDDKTMRSYLRPSTLFGPKFAEYLAAPEPMQSVTERIKADQKTRIETDLEHDRNELERINTELEQDGSNWDLIDRKEYLDNRIRQFTKQLGAI